MNQSSGKSLRVGLIQARVRADYSSTLDNTTAMVREAAAKGARLVVLEELFASPYFCQTQDPDQFKLAEPSDGPSVLAMTALARELRISLVVPFFERRAPGLFHNSLVLIGPSGERLGLYRKMHIPEDPQFEEKFYFTPGDSREPGRTSGGFSAFDIPEARVGTLICWDQWYPEAARLTALQGAQLLVYPTAIGWMPSEKAEQGAAQLSAWQTMQRSHAISNGVFVVSVNRVGLEGSNESGIEFWGHSFVCDPLGRILVEGGVEEEVLIADLDLSLIEDTRKWWPFLRDRRIDAYGAITKRWNDDT